jgi:hypothetical protein
MSDGRTADARFRDRAAGLVRRRHRRGELMIPTPWLLFIIWVTLSAISAYYFINLVKRSPGRLDLFHQHPAVGAVLIWVVSMAWPIWWVCIGIMLLQRQRKGRTT